MIQSLKLPIILACLAALSGCVNLQTEETYHTDYTDLQTDNAQAASELNKQIQDKKIIIRTIAVTTLSDVEQMNSTSPEAQMSSEILAAELAKFGYPVIEVKLSDSLNIEANGEFSLSRDLKDLPKDIDASHLLVGTYMENKGELLITIRLIDLKARTIVAAETYQIK